MRSRELAPDHTHHASGGEAEDHQQDPREESEHRHEEAAEVQPDQIFEDHQAERAISALSGGIAQNDGGVCGIELFVNLQPVAN